MYIDKYKNADGEYVDESGEVFGDAEAFLVSALGFCHCGAPDTAIKYVRDALQLVTDLKGKVWEEEMTHDQWSENVRGLFPSEGAEYFMWYWLDEKALTEHGGSVPGWLTADGEEMLSDLNEFLAQH